MADESDAGEGAGDQAPTASAGGDPVRAAFLAASDDELNEGTLPAKPAPKKKSESEEVEVDEVADDLEDEADEIESEEDEIDDEEDEDEERPGKDDPDLTNRLAMVEKREKRMRQRLEASESQFEQRKASFMAEWKPKIEAAEAFAKDKAKASGDPLAMAKLFGYTEDDFEDLSKIFHGHSKAAQSDPKWKDYARRLQMDQATRRELAELRESNKTIQQRLEQEQAQRDALQRRDEYLARAAKSVSDKTPLLKKDLERSEAVTREKLRVLAKKVLDKTGAAPDPKKLAALYEKRRRAGLERDKDLFEHIKAAPEAPAKKVAAPTTKKTAPIETKTTAAPVEVKTNGTRVAIPGREKMLENLQRLQRGEIGVDDFD